MTKSNVFANHWQVRRTNDTADLHVSTQVGGFGFSVHSNVQSNCYLPTYLKSVGPKTWLPPLLMNKLQMCWLWFRSCICQHTRGSLNKLLINAVAGEELKGRKREWVHKIRLVDLSLNLDNKRLTRFGYSGPRFRAGGIRCKQHQDIQSRS